MFTLSELLSVIAIIAILAALPLPALSWAKAKAQGISCPYDLRRLTHAWFIYVGEDDDRLPPIRMGIRLPYNVDSSNNPD